MGWLEWWRYDYRELSYFPIMAPEWCSGEVVHFVLEFIVNRVFCQIRFLKKRICNVMLGHLSTDVDVDADIGCWSWYVHVHTSMAPAWRSEAQLHLTTTTLMLMVALTMTWTFTLDVEVDVGMCTQAWRSRGVRKLSCTSIVHVPGQRSAMHCHGIYLRRADVCNTGLPTSPGT